MFKKLKQKRCSNCKYYLKTHGLKLCERPDKNNLNTLKVLKLLCLKKKRKENDRHENVL